METAKMSPAKPIIREQVLFAEIIASMPERNPYFPEKIPYYSIAFQKLDGSWHNGYGSYDINYVYESLYTCFDVVSERTSGVNYDHVRKTDDLGRIVIPRDIQKCLGIKEGTKFEFSMLESGDVLMKRMVSDEP